MLGPPVRTRAAGSGLIESIAAMAILGTAVAAGITLFGLHENTVASERAAGAALRYLTRELESVRMTDYAALASTTATPVPEDAAYSLRRDVTQTSSGVRTVEIFVEWTGPNGVARSESLVTRRCEGVE